MATMANVTRRIFMTANVIRRLHVLSLAKCVENSLHINSNAIAALGVPQRRTLTLSSRRYQQAEGDEEAEEGQGDETEDVTRKSPRPEHDVDTSKRYMASKAYQITYGDDPVWVPYRRNHKGRLAPMKTRQSCIRGGQMRTGNPCPICRDEYLVLHPENPDLLKQFISDQSGEVISYSKTGVCQIQHKRLLIAVEKAWDTGTIEKPIPFRHYDYSTYYPNLPKH